jgi:hypothetical protein
MTRRPGARHLRDARAPDVRLENDPTDLAGAGGVPSLYLRHLVRWEDERAASGAGGTTSRGTWCPVRSPPAPRAGLEAPGKGPALRNRARRFACGTRAMGRRAARLRSQEPRRHHRTEGRRDAASVITRKGDPERRSFVAADGRDGDGRRTWAPPTDGAPARDRGTNAGAGPQAASTTGSSTPTSAPPSGRFLAQTRPFIAAASARTAYRPIPAPGAVRTADGDR